MDQFSDNRPAAGDRVRGTGYQLNLTRLRYFVAVAQELHFGRAANRLGMSQPPLSHHIHELEKEIGAKLFTRSSRRVALTASGRILLGKASQLLEHAERVSHVMQSVGAGEFGELLIGCVPSALYDVMPRLALAYRKAHPDVRLALREGHTADLTHAIMENTLDAGLAWCAGAPKPLASETVLKESFSAVVPVGHRFAKAKSLSLEELASEPLILPPRKISPYHYDHILSSFARRGLHPRLEYEVATIISQIGYAAAGFGIAIAPSFARKLAADDVVVIAIDEEMPPVALSLLWNTERVTPQVEQLRDVINSEFGARISSSD
jgi:DNA-binding transcriptional LysR family regulator